MNLLLILFLTALIHLIGAWFCLFYLIFMPAKDGFSLEHYYTQVDIFPFFSEKIKKIIEHFKMATNENT